MLSPLVRRTFYRSDSSTDCPLSGFGRGRVCRRQVDRPHEQRGGDGAEDCHGRGGNCPEDGAQVGRDCNVHSNQVNVAKFLFPRSHLSVKVLYTVFRQESALHLFRHLFSFLLCRFNQAVPIKKAFLIFYSVLRNWLPNGFCSGDNELCIVSS